MYKDKENDVRHLIEKLDILNPLYVLKRGYSIVKKDDKNISSIDEFKKDDEINIMVKDGNIKAKVMEVNNG